MQFEDHVENIMFFKTFEPVNKQVLGYKNMLNKWRCIKYKIRWKRYIHFTLFVVLFLVSYVVFVNPVIPFMESTMDSSCFGLKCGISPSKTCCIWERKHFSPFLSENLAVRKQDLINFSSKLPHFQSKSVKPQMLCTRIRSSGHMLRSHSLFHWLKGCLSKVNDPMITRLILY